MRVANFAAGMNAVIWSVADNLEEPFFDVAYKWPTADFYAALHRVEAKAAIQKIDQKRSQPRAASPTKFGSQWKR